MMNAAHMTLSLSKKNVQKKFSSRGAILLLNPFVLTPFTKNKSGRLQCSTSFSDKIAGGIYRECLGNPWFAPICIFGDHCLRLYFLFDAALEKSWRELIWEWKYSNKEGIYFQLMTCFERNLGLLELLDFFIQQNMNTLLSSCLVFYVKLWKNYCVHFHQKYRLAHFSMKLYSNIQLAKHHH